MAFHEGAVYVCANRRSHPGMTARITRVSVNSIEVTVLKGQNRGRSSRFRFPRALFEKDFQPASIRGGDPR